MTAEQLIRDGDLAGALKALQDAVRKDPSGAKHRVFLFQLLSVTGDWARALTQLNVAAELDAFNVPMAQTYRETIQCEALRAEIFEGKRAPLIFGEPASWMAQLLEALKLDATDPAAAAAVRAQAFEAAPATSGNIDGTPFEWIADADQRLGPMLEAIVNGRYFWIPFARISRIEMEAPTDLRDAVWTAANFTWANGATTVGLIPTRYIGTATSGDDALRLSRRTDWTEEGFGLGQRMLATDGADFALLDARVIELDTLEEDSSAGVPADSDADSADHG